MKIVRYLQAILKEIIGAGVNLSVRNFDMSEIKYEVLRVEIIGKVKQMRYEWQMRMRLDQERKEEKEKISM